MKLSKTHTTEYANWLAELKQKIKSAQLKAAVSVNRELLQLYWEIGQSLSRKVESERVLRDQSLMCKGTITNYMVMQIEE